MNKIIATILCLISVIGYGQIAPQQMEPSPIKDGVMRSKNQQTIEGQTVYLYEHDITDSLYLSAGDTLKMKYAKGKVKLSSGSGGVTAVTATAPITSSGGLSPNIAIPQAGTGTNGYLSSTDWTTFNNKGTVTSITAVSPLTGGTITGSGSIGVPNGTALWNANKLQGFDVSTTTPLSDNILSYNAAGAAWGPVSSNSIISNITSLTPQYLIYGGGTGNLGQSPNLTWNGSLNLKAPLIHNTGSSTLYSVKQLSGSDRFFEGIGSQLGLSTTDWGFYNYTGKTAWQNPTGTILTMQTNRDCDFGAKLKYTTSTTANASSLTGLGTDGYFKTITVSTGLNLSTSGALTNTGVTSFNGGTGAVSGLTGVAAQTGNNAGLTAGLSGSTATVGIVAGSSTGQVLKWTSGTGWAAGTDNASGATAGIGTTISGTNVNTMVITTNRLYNLSSTSQTITTANVYEAVKFGSSGGSNSTNTIVTASGSNVAVKIVDAGTYEVCYNVQFTTSAIETVYFRINKNSLGITSTERYDQSDNGATPQNVYYCDQFSFIANDEISLQVKKSSTSASLTTYNPYLSIRKIY